MKMLVFFPAKCVRNAVKTMVVDRKASKPLRKAANWSGGPTEFEQNRRGKFELFAWTLSPNFFRLDWTFPLPPKRQLSVLLNFFFPLTNLFLTFVVFAFFATTRVNCDFAPKTHGIQHRVISSVGSVLVALWCGRTDVRTYGRTVTWLLRHYQIFWLDRLPNFLSNGAPLTR